MKNCLLMESNHTSLQAEKIIMLGADRMTDTLIIAEEARIDRKIEQGVAKIVAGDADDGDRRAYNAALMRRANLVFQMGLSTERPVEVRRLVAG